MRSSKYFLDRRVQNYLLGGVTFLFIILLLTPTPCFTQDASGSFEHDGALREYDVYLPQNFQPDMPLVINLHGYTQNKTGWANGTKMHEFADTMGFVVVYPQGLLNASGWSCWNTGLRGCVHGYQDTTFDDLGFLSALIDTLHADYGIDLSRVYMCGYSMGGEMTYRMAIEQGYRLAAFASVSGKITDIAAAGGTPIRPFPVLHIHGTEDPVEYYEIGDGNLWSVDSVLAYWRANGSCTGGPDSVTLPDIDTSDGQTVVKYTWDDCADSTQIIHYKVIHGRHQWPSLTGSTTETRDINASLEILKFFKNYQIKSAFSAPPGILSFDTVNIDGSKTDSITVTNIGTHALYVAYASSNTVPIILTPPNAVIPPSDSMKFYITVNPHCFGDFSGNVVFHNSGVGSPNTISITGFAYSSELSVCPQIMDYGNVRLGDTGYDTAYVANPLGSFGAIDSVTSDNPLFTVSLTSDTVLPTNWASVPISFTPDSMMEEQGSIVFYSSEMSVPETVIVNGVGIAPLFALDHDSLDFGDVVVGTTAGTIISVTNDGNWPIHISSVTSDNINFTIPLTLNTVEAGGTGYLSVSYSPAGPSSHTGYIIIEHDAPTSPDSLPVSGRGMIKMSLDSGWNMVSLAAFVPDHRKTVIFPQATSHAFRYVGDYEIVDTLSEGCGYWMKFSSLQTPLFPGPPYESDTIPVRAGWNLIGPTSYPLAVADIGSIPGGITTTEFFAYATAGKSYFTSDTLSPGIAYWVKSDKAGQFIYSFSPPTLRKNTRIKIVPGDDLPPPPPDGSGAGTPGIPLTFALYQNYPNPFNPLTEISYSIPVSRFVRLTIFNILAQEVATLVDERVDGGTHTVKWNAESCPSSIYFYRLTAGDFTETKKMVLIK